MRRELWKALQQHWRAKMTGEPKASDDPQELSFLRDGEGDYVVRFDDEGKFEIPQALVFGG